MKKIISLLLLIICGYIPATEQDCEKKGKIFALIVADTNDFCIGHSVQVDVKCMEKSVSTIGKGINFSLETIVLKGSKISSGNVRHALKKIASSSRDIIFFYYSGHGYNDPAQKTSWPTMCIPPDDIPGNKVQSLIKRKKKRSAIIMFDCCNSFTNREKRILDSRSMIQPFFLKKSHALKAFFDLLLRFRGTITLSASNVGETARGDPYFGGYLTRNFLMSLRELGTEGALSWSKLCQLGANKTSWNVKESCAQEQHPIYSIEEG